MKVINDAQFDFEREVEGVSVGFMALATKFSEMQTTIVSQFIETHFVRDRIFTSILVHNDFSLTQNHCHSIHSQIYSNCMPKITKLCK